MSLFRYTAGRAQRGFLCAGLGVVLLAGAMPGVVYARDSGLAGDAEKKDYVCLPAADGEGWDCHSGAEAQQLRRDLQRRPRVNRAESQASQPVTTQTEAPSSGVTQSATDAEAATAGAASASVLDNPKTPSEVTPEDADAALTWGATSGTSGPVLDAETARVVNADPEALYVATPARSVLPSHQLDRQLASSMYVTQGSGDGFCAGRYETRPWLYPTDADNADYPIVAEADTLTHQFDGQAHLIGNVSLQQGNRYVIAPQAQLDQPTRVATFSEGVRMDQPGLTMQGQAATIQLNTKEATVDDAQFVLTDIGMRGEASQLEQSASGNLSLAEPNFTRCEPGNNGWLLTTDSLLIEEDAVFGTARGAVLRLKSVPVFYTPYLQFPVSDERLSGFLFPNLSYSDEDGVDVSIPYYFNIAPNYDATVIPRYISDRGAGGEAEFRYKSSWGETTFSGALLPEDDLYNGILDKDDFDELGGEAVLGEFDPADRWLGAINHEGGFGRFRTFVDYTAASDRDYFRDLGSDLAVSSRRELQRKGEIQYNHGGLFMRLWAQRFQRLDEATRKEYERLPEVEMLYSGLLGPLEYSLGAKWADFDRDIDNETGINALTGSRTHLEPRVTLPFRWPFGFLSVSGGYRYTSYDLEQDLSNAGPVIDDLDPNRGIGLGTVDGGLFFERDLNWFDTPLIQTLEPRLYYLYQEYDNQDDLPRFDASELTFGYSQLYRTNRFSGLDRIGDANQLSAGVTTRFLNRLSGREYFSFSIGEIYYFEDRRVTLNGFEGPDEEQSSSAVAAEMSASIARNWRIRGTVVWDPHDNEVDEGGAAIQFKLDNRRIINLGFRNRRDEDIEQTDFSLYWPISDRFSIMGRWNHDLNSGRTIEGFGGIEYSDCCLQVRLMARRFLDAPTARQLSTVEADDGVFLQIVFKGLAGFGTKVESVLERGIRGYYSPEPSSYFSN